MARKASPAAAAPAFASGKRNPRTKAGTPPAPNPTPAPEKIRTGGSWSASDPPKYFIAGVIRPVTDAALRNNRPMDVLLPVNEIKTAGQEEIVERVLDRGGSVYLDSGCFNLCNLHAQKHGMQLIEALALPPESLDGFDALMDRYIHLVKRFGDRLWGYVEVDIGGRENKIKTRKHLEGLGLRPIPVYHPLSDGWDYFDELAQTYDRVCFANLGTAPPETRKRLLATAWERRRKYPDLWLHALGVTPSPVLLSYPVDSCDSSSWHAGARFGNMHTWAATQALWTGGRGWRFDASEGAEGPRGTRAAYRLYGYNAAHLGDCMRRMLADQRHALGCDLRGTEMA